MSKLERSNDLKSYMLLLAIIFYYHGLDEEEEEILNKKAAEEEAQEELKWAHEFIEQDYMTAFERARVYFKKTIGKFERAKRLSYINDTWIANGEKGYITEMETTAILKLAKDWDVDEELVASIHQLI